MLVGFESVWCNLPTQRMANIRSDVPFSRVPLSARILLSPKKSFSQVWESKIEDLRNPNFPKLST